MLGVKILLRERHDAVDRNTSRSRHLAVCPSTSWRRSARRRRPSSRNVFVFNAHTGGRFFGQRQELLHVSRIVKEPPDRVLRVRVYALRFGHVRPPSRRKVRGWFGGRGGLDPVSKVFKIKSAVADSGKAPGQARTDAVPPPPSWTALPCPAPLLPATPTR